MAILDNLLVRVQPVAGDTVPKNIVDSANFTGTGTPTLGDASGTKFWQVATGTLLKTPATFTLADANSGLTLALRFRRTADGTDSFMPMVGWLPSGGAVNNCPLVGFNGTNSYRGRLNNSAVGNALTSGKANNVIHTLVWRFETSSVNAQDFGKLWFNQVGRVGDAPDVISSGQNAAANTYIEAFINCQTSAGFDLFDFMVWSGAKTDAECAAVADDIRGQIPAPSGGTTPIAFTGTVPNQTFTNGDAVSVDLSTYFSGTQTPFAFANTGTALTGTGLTISSVGLLSGTATTGSVTGVIATGTDADLATASSNAFNVTVNAAATPVSFTGTVPTLSGTQNSAITPVNLSTYFSGSLTPFTYSLQAGTLPTGLTLNSSTGIISGTPTVSFSGSITVRATDTGSNSADTNSFLVDIAAASTDGTITLSPLKNNTATPLASVSGFYVTILSSTNPKTVVYNTASVSSNASAAITFTNAAIVQGTEYRYFIEKDGVAFAAGKVTAT